MSITGKPIPMSIFMMANTITSMRGVATATTNLFFGIFIPGS
jgi:hypothetical protein